MVSEEESSVDHASLWKIFLIAAREKYQTTSYFQSFLCVVLTKADPERAKKCDLKLEPAFAKQFEDFLRTQRLLTPENNLQTGYHDPAKKSILLDAFTHTPKVDSDWLPPLSPKKLHA